MGVCAVAVCASIGAISSPSPCTDRLIANVAIAYNSMLLSELLGRSLATGNEKALDLLNRISPAAWRHLHFLGRSAFRGNRNSIDLEPVLARIDYEYSPALERVTTFAGLGFQPTTVPMRQSPKHNVLFLPGYY
jgi:hypothetical protein